MKKSRFEKRITIGSLSFLTGIKVARLSDLENRRSEPTGDEVDKIAIVLGNKIKFAGMEEADEGMKQLEAMMDGMDKAYHEIRRRGYGKGNGVSRDAMECPVCGSTLFFRVANCNGHVHARCKTDGCLSWME